MNVLVTGGAGYIGSHCVKRLLELAHDVVILDNLHRGNRAAVDRLRDFAQGKNQRLAFIEGDIGDRQVVSALLADHDPDAIMHFAALAYVRESVDRPFDYYTNNAVKSLVLIEEAIRAKVPRFVFSSTCATYGEPPQDRIPIREDCPQSPINPYGWSKLMIERALIDAQRALERAAEPVPGVAMLRYFNVAGCDRAGLVGEDHDPETHLIPIVLQVAQGRRETLTIFGEDYDTPDGTCVRDYIHVEDLVEAHVMMLDALAPGECRQYNLGLGRGTSIREIVDAARRVTGAEIPTVPGPQHPGDPPTLYCDASKIMRDVGWTPQITDLDDIIASAWRWFQAHPNGY